MEHLFEYKDNDLFFHHSVDMPPHDMLYGMHIHEIYEIFYLISGTGEFIIEGNSYSITPGCIILLKSNEAHHIRMNTNERYERIVLHFYPDILDGITNGKALLIPFDRPLGVNNLFLPSADADNQIRKCLFDILAEKGTKEDIRLSIQVNLFKILHTIKNNLNIDIYSDYDTKNARINEILNFINEHLFESISVNYICDKFFISKSYLSQLFKESTGTSLWNYVLSKRLTYSKNLIRSGVPATIAANQCGFSDYTSFFRAYKKHFGTAPSDNR